MFRKTVASIVLVLCTLLATSCDRPSRQGDGARGKDNARTPSGSNDDLSVPRLDPKPVIWIEDWAGIDEVSQARQKAQAMMSVADLLKAREKFEEAEEYYEKAMEADPTWGYPAYQSACNYELWNEHDRAEQQFAKAVELGFNDFPTALTDDELGQIREGSGFNAALLKIRELYVASAKTCVGQPIAFRRISEPREDFSTWVLARRITRNVVDR